jgi:uncharacterized protein YbaR (Trm112 family)
MASNRLSTNLMKSAITQKSQFDPSVLSRLACPACHGDLRPESSAQSEPGLVCTTCARAYPIVDGIPVLIAERATGPEK